MYGFRDFVVSCRGSLWASVCRRCGAGAGLDDRACPRRYPRAYLTQNDEWWLLNTGMQYVKFDNVLTVPASRFVTGLIPEAKLHQLYRRYVMDRLIGKVP